MKKLITLFLMMLIFLMAACSPAAPAAQPEAMADDGEAVMDEPMADDAMADDAMLDSHDDTMTDDDMMDEPMADDTMTDGDMMDEPMADDAMSDGDMTDDAMMIAAWQTLALTDARTGESFTLADFSGKTVFVEPMATWCSNCRRQLENVQAARSQLNSDEVVFVALSVETNISNEDLARYAEDTGFDWVFAVATPELLDALVSEYGRSIINPPSTPHFIIRPDGSTTELVTGIESADQIISQIQAAQG